MSRDSTIEDDKVKNTRLSMVEDSPSKNEGSKVTQVNQFIGFKPSFGQRSKTTLVEEESGEDDSSSSSSSSS